MEKNELPSIRKYVIVFIEGATANTHFQNLSQLLDNTDDFEWRFAVQQNFDRILDLKVGEKIHMNFNRDSLDSAGLIKRIN